jgi:hypothetical protein
MSRLSIQCGILNISEPYRPPWPDTGIALLCYVSVGNTGTVGMPLSVCLCGLVAPLEDKEQVALCNGSDSGGWREVKPDLALPEPLNWMSTCASECSSASVSTGSSGSHVYQFRGPLPSLCLISPQFCGHTKYADHLRTPDDLICFR